MAIQSENDNDEAVTLFRYNLLSQGGDASQKRAAVAKGAWLTTFWIPAQHRKHPSYALVVENDDDDDDDNDDDKTVLIVRKKRETITDEDKKNCPDWDKLLQKDLKKIRVEDLGDLSAQDLWGSIPEEDKDGRGRKDIQRLEQQLSVKVVFWESHVLLVGPKAKLEKKCLVIRNVLSHYYWRLKGKQINL